MLLFVISSTFAMMNADDPIAVSTSPSPTKQSLAMRSKTESARLFLNSCMSSLANTAEHEQLKTELETRFEANTTIMFSEINKYMLEMLKTIDKAGYFCGYIEVHADAINAVAKKTTSVAISCYDATNLVHVARLLETIKVDDTIAGTKGEYNPDMEFFAQNIRHIIQLACFMKPQLKTNVSQAEIAEIKCEKYMKPTKTVATSSSCAVM